MIYLVLVGAGILLLLIGLFSGRKKHNYLEAYNKTVRVYSLANDDQAVDFSTLTERTFRQRMADKRHNLSKQLGKYAFLKLVSFIALLIFVGGEINYRFIRGNEYLVVAIIVAIGIYLGHNWLQKREQQRFEEAFPDALNILTSAVSAGESIMHAIMYVGKTLDGDVGAEFKVMGDRLQMGDTPDEVFKKSCQRFPYPSFHFFVITLRANMHRGGQLKEVMTRLNRLMFNARAIDKKKYALTSEARMSAKIVASIPFIFLIMMQYISPENYEFVMTNDAGKPILYYLLISEFIGISIVWGLMKGVR
ncbi:pilus assembly protein TadB [Vibrio sp. HA2012]|uniref:type II secretion system F family protein n=1 Tax=Vibrio sp. HA2012 TaxID=1971595 RepID=UPI000C2B6A00|nr:type II secretion system F family protein [Vibrio sp. HA2012]PJC86108.1 pilus assembly protein TadB [Vibrio sp. HA2012]